ncbi:MAG TPA: DUF802 domain-containing protein [Paraburkholderia sp.]|jgi:hypothetical protein|nr:DUF802 domain-containing protein [Paraburkholderia sp.]
MSRLRIDLPVFVAGLAVVGWVALANLVANPLASAVTLLIGACYVAGALELRHYRDATSTLSRALANLATPPARLADWLDQLHPSLASPVRTRIEGTRAALPGPLMTPYLVGLLVLLGMFGTLLGMLVTLRGTGAALESAVDPATMRASLAAPVKGLGFAFGTSIAGVATSAALGLVSALYRRERSLAALSLDAAIATTLKTWSHAHQREETFRLMQRQADAMPALADRMHAMIAALEQQSFAANERLFASQQAFLAHAQTEYARLASSVGLSLKDSVAQSARHASAALHDALTRSVERHLDGLSSGFAATTNTVADTWRDALDQHRHADDALVQHLRASLDQFADTFGRRSDELVARVSSRVETAADRLSNAWDDALSLQRQSGERLATDNRVALEAAAATLEAHATSLVRSIDQSHAALQTELASRDQQRLAAWTDALATIADALRHDWQQTSEQAAARQQAICDTLAGAAENITAQTRAHASETIAEIGRLVDAASVAPKAAADVIAELRAKLSDSMVRDTAMQEERNRLLDTLGTLLDAVNHASADQRAAIDALVATSADLLERVGSRFGDRIEQGARTLDGVAAQIAGSAVEVASLGDAFGAAVQRFGESNDQLVAHLQRIEAALDKSLARSDEQLAYYVAQAREVVDLSVLSQKQIIEDLQRVADQRASAGGAVA